MFFSNNYFFKFFKLRYNIHISFLKKYFILKNIFNYYVSINVKNLKKFKKIRLIIHFLKIIFSIFFNNVIN